MAGNLDSKPVLAGSSGFINQIYEVLKKVKNSA